MWFSRASCFHGLSALFWLCMVVYGSSLVGAVYVGFEYQSKAAVSSARLRCSRISAYSVAVGTPSVIMS